MTIHQGGTLTEAVRDRLDTTELLVGVGVKPAGGGWQGTPGVSPFVPYVVVHPSTGGDTDGPLDDPHAFAFPDYTLTAVGGSAEQCQLAADWVFEAMLSAPLVVAGRTVEFVEPEILPGATRDDKAEPHVWFAPARWTIATSPD